MSTEKVCLLVDNSNTRTKFALVHAGLEPEIRMLPTVDLSEETILRLLDDWFFERVCLCSVVPHAAGILESALRNYSLARVTPEAALTVDFSSYPGVETLGADRVANVLAAVQCVPLPLVAVDLGTAATLDVVVQGEPRPVFKGGMIAPGYAAVSSCLHTATAQLPPVSAPECPQIIGRNTQEAMYSAVRLGYPAMIESLLDAIEIELSERINVVLTGGDATMVASSMKRKCRIEPRLTLQGIAIAAGFCL